MSDRRIFLCADDYGISPAVNVAIRDLVVRGRLNATSVLVTAPSCGRSEARALAALNSASPRVSIGLHFPQTAPFRPASGGFRPLRNGAFLPLPAVMGHALLHRFDPGALAAEVAGQLQRFVDLLGRTPDFIDGHQHVHLLPQVRDAVLTESKKAAPNAWLRQCGRVGPLRVRLGDGKGLLLDLASRSFRRRAAALSLHTNPAFAGAYAFTDDADFAALFPRFLDSMPDGGLVMCHPGFVDAELQALDPLTNLREREYSFLASERLRALLQARGMVLN